MIKRILLCLALLLPLMCLAGCEQPQEQLDYSTLEMSSYGVMPKEALSAITLSLPKELSYTDADWQAYLTSLLNTYPKITYVTEGTVGAEDIIRMRVTATEGEELLFSYTEEELEYPMANGDFMNIEGFRRHIEGTPLRETVTFTLAVGEHHSISWLKGKEVTFTVTPVSVKREEILSTPDSDYILHTLGWQTSLTDPDEVVRTFLTTLREEWETAMEEDLSHAKEDAILAYLLSIYEPTAYPSYDLSYNLTALIKYYEACRLYDNQILENWADPQDASPSLSHYLMRTYSLSTPLDALSRLTEEALTLTEENMAVATAFHTLDLTLSSPSSDPHQNNLALYDLTLQTLLSRTTFTFA